MGDLQGWRKYSRIVGNNPSLDADGGRMACGASLSLLSLASPGLAIRGEPVQRDKGPLDLCLYPLHPSRPPLGGAR